MLNETSDDNGNLSTVFPSQKGKNKSEIWHK